MNIENGTSNFQHYFNLPAFVVLIVGLSTFVFSANNVLAESAPELEIHGTNALLKTSKENLEINLSPGNGGIKHGDISLMWLVNKKNVSSSDIMPLLNLSKDAKPGIALSKPEVKNAESVQEPAQDMLQETQEPIVTQPANVPSSTPVLKDSATTVILPQDNSQGLTTQTNPNSQLEEPINPALNLPSDTLPQSSTQGDAQDSNGQPQSSDTASTTDTAQNGDPADNIIVPPALTAPVSPGTSANNNDNAPVTNPPANAPVTNGDGLTISAPPPSDSISSPNSTAPDDSVSQQGPPSTPSQGTIQTFYLDDDGAAQAGYNGALPVGSMNHPYASLEQALLQIPDQSVLNVKAGNYDWTNAIDTINKRISIVGIDAQKPLIALDAVVTLTSQASGSQFKNFQLFNDSGHSFLYIEPGQTVNDIVVDGVDYSNTQNYVGLIETGDNATVSSNNNWAIKNSTFECSRDGYSCILLRNFSNLLIEGNTFHSVDNSANDLAFLFISNPRGNIYVIGNTFAAPGGSGLHIKNQNATASTDHLYIINNTFFGARYTDTEYYQGAIYEESCIAETVMNNLFMNNATYAIHTYNGSCPNPAQSYVDYNYLYNNHGTADNSADDISDYMNSKYSPESFTHLLFDVNPGLISTNYGETGYLTFNSSSPAASGAFGGTIPGYPFSVYKHLNVPYFGVHAPSDS